MLGKTRGEMLAPVAARALNCHLSERGEIALAAAADKALDIGLLLDLAWAKAQMEMNPTWVASGRPTLPGSLSVKLPVDKSRRRRGRAA